MADHTPQVYVGRGNVSMQDEYIDFINYVFGFDGASDGFYMFLPKLYPESLDPAGNSFVVTEDGRLKAAVGAFPHKLSVCGDTLDCIGIGNVAVHPFSRHKGYMRAALNAAMDDAVARHADLSILGGARQRYNYFSFDKLGASCNFSIYASNIRHALGSRVSRYAIHEVKEGDTADLDAIAALSDAQAYHPIRPRHLLYATLLSWHNAPYAVTYKDSGRFAGYFVGHEGHINELLLTDTSPDATLDFVVAARETFGDLHITLPYFEQKRMEPLCRLAEGYEVGLDKSFSVLNYRRVTAAFMRLKQTYTALPDGRLVLLIHGRAGDEQLALEVKGGQVSVTPTADAPQYEFDHLAAMNFLFATLCPARMSLPDFARLWLPLPLWLYSADAV